MIRPQRQPEIPAHHPGQIEPLLHELRARGWTEQRIDERVRPILQSNPYLHGPAVNAGRATD